MMLTEKCFLKFSLKICINHINLPTSLVLLSCSCRRQLFPGTREKYSTFRISGILSGKKLLTLNLPVFTFRRLLLTIANSLDSDQARQDVGPDLNPNCLTL